MWELDVAITDVLRVFEKIESKLQTVETEGSHSLYGDSELFYKNTLALQDEMRSHLEKTRMIIASTKEVIFTRKLTMLSKQICLNYILKSINNFIFRS